MRHTKTWFLLCVVLVLTGQGCLGFGGQKAKGADGGVFATNNAGETWVQTVAVPGPKSVGTMANANILAMEMDPQDNRVIYLGTRESGLLYSEDAGASWRQAHEEALKTGKVTAIEVDPQDVCTAYVAVGPRLYKTESCLRSFNSEAYVETRPGVTISQIEIDWYNPQVVWLGLSNGDIMKSEDGGVSWRTSVMAKDEVTALLVSAKDSRMILVGTASNGFYRTADAGATWTQIEKELRELRNGNRVYALTQTADASVVIAASKYGLMRSKDFGASWEGITLLTAPGQVTIKAIGVAPTDPKTLYYAALSTFYVSKDGGTTWKTSKLKTARLPEALLVDPKNVNMVYLGVAAPEKK